MSATKSSLPFSLGLEDASEARSSIVDMKTQKMTVSKPSTSEERPYPFMAAQGSQNFNHSSSSSSIANMPVSTESLNPNRPPECLTSEIFELICSQMKYIVGEKVSSLTFYNFYYMNFDYDYMIIILLFLVLKFINTKLHQSYWKTK